MNFIWIPWNFWLDKMEEMKIKIKLHSFQLNNFKTNKTSDEKVEIIENLPTNPNITIINTWSWLVFTCLVLLIEIEKKLYFIFIVYFLSIFDCLLKCFMGTKCKSEWSKWVLETATITIIIIIFIICKLNVEHIFALCKISGC